MENIKGHRVKYSGTLGYATGFRGMDTGKQICKDSKVQHLPLPAFFSFLESNSRRKGFKGLKDLKVSKKSYFLNCALSDTG